MPELTRAAGRYEVLEPVGPGMLAVVCRARLSDSRRSNRAGAAAPDGAGRPCKRTQMPRQTPDARLRRRCCYGTATAQASADCNLAIWQSAVPRFIVEPCGRS